MNFTKIDSTKARVSNITSILLLKDMLMEHGAFGADDNTYTIDTIMGGIKFKLLWENHAVTIEIKKKPPFVSHDFIWEQLERRMKEL